MFTEPTPTPVRTGGPSTRVIVVVMTAVLASVAGFAIVTKTPRLDPSASPHASSPQARTPSTPSVRVAQATSVPHIPIEPVVTSVPPSSPRVLLAVSANEAWCASAESGLWHFSGGSWTSVRVPAWPAAGIFDVARAPDGTLAVATDYGAAILRDGQWSIVAAGLTRHVLFARDGSLVVAAGSTQAGDVATTLSAYTPRGSGWRRTVYPTVTSRRWPVIGIGPDGAPWVGTGAYDGSLEEFDAGRWVSVNPLGGVAGVDVAGLVTAPDGALWAALYSGGGARTTWAVARYDGEGWFVHQATPDAATPGDVVAPNGLAIAPDGTVWLPTEWGLVHLGDAGWSTHFPQERFENVSFGLDGSRWAIGPNGVQELDPETP